jgi:hypothetical protein
MRRLPWKKNGQHRQRAIGNRADEQQTNDKTCDRGDDRHQDLERRSGIDISLDYEILAKACKWKPGGTALAREAPRIRYPKLSVMYRPEGPQRTTARAYAKVSGSWDLFENHYAAAALTSERFA